MQTHIRILNAERKPVAILENAYAIGYERNINGLWNAGFSLPLDDPKNEQCKPFNYVELTDVDGAYIGLFRIVPVKTRKLATINEISYYLEHVLASLLNDVLFMYHQRSNFTTRSNIEYILSQQTTKHWRLGEVDFTRYFHYKWENENGLLGALFSITEPFDEPFEWTWDTQSYPWTLNLVTPSDKPTAEIRYGKNLAEIEREVDPSNIVNRLYPLGYGEGVNQLNIRNVNGGQPYIDNAASIAEYGLQSYVWVDRRFEDEESLYASAQAFLDEWSVPIVSYRVKAVDLSSLTGLSIDEFTVGKVVRVVDPEIGTFNARIVAEDKQNMLGEPYDINLTLSNKAEGLGATLADIERRQEINEVYSQGATNIDSYTFNDNADPDFPATLEFILPDDMVNLNESTLRIRTSKFRGYTRGSEAGGHYQKSSVVQSKSTAGGGGATTSAGGGATTSSGGGTSRSTQSGGGTSATSSAGGAHNHIILSRSANQGVAPTTGSWYMDSGGDSYYIYGSPAAYMTSYGVSQSHSHTVTVPAHSHDFSTPNHTHTVAAHTHTVSDHSHNFEITIPAINIPSHSHEQIYGIYEHNSLPTSLTVKIDDKVVAFSGTSGEIDITQHLAKDTSGKVRRGWHKIEVAPNDLARISLIVSNRFFVQSHIGGNY